MASSRSSKEVRGSGTRGCASLWQLCSVRVAETGTDSQGALKVELSRFAHLKEHRRSTGLRYKILQCFFSILFTCSTRRVEKEVDLRRLELLAWDLKVYV